MAEKLLYFHLFQNFLLLLVYISRSSNNSSNSLDISCSNSAIEDINKLSIKMINNIYKNHNINHIDIYKSCHHGGSGTNTDELCNLMKCKYAIITNTDRWLNNYNTFVNLKNANKDVNILVTDHQKYIFNIKDKITYDIIKDESLFIILNKD